MKVFIGQDNLDSIGPIDLYSQQVGEGEPIPNINQHIDFQKRFRKDIKRVSQREFYKGQDEDDPNDSYKKALMSLYKYYQNGASNGYFRNVIDKLISMARKQDFDPFQGCKPLIITNPQLIFFPPMTIQSQGGDPNRVIEDGLVTVVPYMSPTGFHMIPEIKLKEIKSEQNIVDMVVNEIRNNLTCTETDMDPFVTQYSYNPRYNDREAILFNTIYCDDSPVFSEVAMQTFEDLSD